MALLAMLLLSACSPERNLARQYVKQHKGNGIMIIPVYQLFKDNLSISYDTAKHYTPVQFDSISWVQSTFIQHISDSLFLTSFINSMINTLSADGYDVYLDAGSDVFLSLPDPKWVVQIAQLQLDEKYDKNYYEVNAFDGGDARVESLKINQVTLSSWLEVSRANAANKQVLFLEAYIQDEIKRGVNFNLMEGSVDLEQLRFAIQLDDVYIMANDLGQKHAEMLFDYFMNDYIGENLPSGIANRQYFRFDPKSKSLKKGLKERFEVVK